MNDNKTPDQHQDAEAQARRKFLQKVGKAGATAPAVMLLMAANVRPASAQSTYGGGGTGTGGGGGGSGSACSILSD